MRKGITERMSPSSQTPAGRESEGEEEPVQDCKLPTICLHLTWQRQRGNVLKVKRKDQDKENCPLTPALTRLNLTLTLRTRRPAPHRQLTGMSLSKLRLVERMPEPGTDSGIGKTDAKT